MLTTPLQGSLPKRFKYFMRYLLKRTCYTFTFNQYNPQPFKGYLSSMPVYARAAMRVYEAYLLYLTCGLWKPLTCGCGSGGFIPAADLVMCLSDTHKVPRSYCLRKAILVEERKPVLLKEDTLIEGSYSC